jgi:trehalose-phosphatase
MPEEDQRARLQRMQAILSVQTVNKWAADFINGLNTTCIQNDTLRKKRIVPTTIAQIKLKYNQAKQRLILLDYDGTLTALKPRPEDAKPTPELISILQQLASDPANHIVINSGRDHFILEKWFGLLPVSMAAEHGAFYKENGVWHKKIKKTEWGTGLLSILQMFVDRTPRSHLEIKETALAWHYRESDAWLGTLRAQQLVNALVSICTRQKLQILQGNKVVEVKSPDCNKGSEVERLLANRRYDFVMAMGDDTTDEDMFQALPAKAVTIKIGNVSKAANYNLPAQSDVLPFLQSMLRKQKNTDTTKSYVRNRLTSAFSFFRDLLKTK